MFKLFKLGRTVLQEILKLPRAVNSAGRNFLWGCSSHSLRFCLLMLGTLLKLFHFFFFLEAVRADERMTLSNAQLIKADLFVKMNVSGFGLCHGADISSHPRGRMAALSGGQQPPKQRACVQIAALHLCDPVQTASWCAPSNLSLWLGFKVQCDAALLGWEVVRRTPKGSWERTNTRMITPLGQGGRLMENSWISFGGKG